MPHFQHNMLPLTSMFHNLQTGFCGHTCAIHKTAYSAHNGYLTKHEKNRRQHPLCNNECPRFEKLDHVQDDLRKDDVVRVLFFPPPDHVIPVKEKDAKNTTTYYRLDKDSEPTLYQGALSLQGGGICTVQF